MTSHHSCVLDRVMNLLIFTTIFLFSVTVSSWFWIFLMVLKVIMLCDSKTIWNFASFPSYSSFSLRVQVSAPGMSPGSGTSFYIDSLSSLFRSQIALAWSRSVIQRCPVAGGRRGRWAGQWGGCVPGFWSQLFKEPPKFTLTCVLTGGEHEWSPFFTRDKFTVQLPEQKCVSGRTRGEWEERRKRSSQEETKAGRIVAK